MKIILKNISKKFKKKEVLNDINITMCEGIYGLLGPNGSGKTTLIRCIMGLYKPEDGIIGIGNAGEILTDYSDKIGYLPQQLGCYKDLTVYENLEYFCILKKIPKYKWNEEIEHCLDIVNLSDQKNSKAGKLSGGMQRRLGIAQALLNDPPILIFDEPTVGLDPEERLRFKNLVSKIADNKIIIVSTHIIEDVEAVCNSVIVIRNGKILFHNKNRELEVLGNQKVYEMSSSEEDLNQTIVGEYKIISFKEREGEKLTRILTKEIQNQWEPVISNIEDGYLYAENFL